MQTKKKFLKHIHYFRGFAILNIVFIHTWYSPALYVGSNSNAVIDVTRAVTFHSSTIYFLFISGFLFFYLSTNFNLVKYYKNKLLNVISPYIFLTIAILIFENYNSIIQYELDLIRFSKKLVWTLIRGNVKVQYWYIPFISLVFVISPLFLKIPKKVFKKLVIITCLLPLFGTRTETKVSILQYIYFFPIYLLGIYAAMDYDVFIAGIKKRRNLLLILSTLTTILLVFIHDKTFQFGWVDIIQSIYYIQKISICFLMLLLLIKLEKMEITLLNYLATYSFAIYFTHTLVHNGYTIRLYDLLFFHKFPYLIIPLSVVYAITITLKTLFICMIVKRLLGKHSRILIGA